MRRSPFALLSPSKLRQLVWLPRTIRMFRDWPGLMMNWAGISDTGRSYRLRDGGVVRTTQGIDAATVGVVFVRQDYGPVPAHARTIVDIGANIGAFTLLAARLAPSARVISFEPMPEAYETLASNVRENGMEGRVETHRLGVAGATETRRLTLASTTVFNSLYCDGDRTIDIDCLSLAEVFERFGLERIDLLKLDCEGAEYEILYQAPPALLGRIETMRMEYHTVPEIDGGSIAALTAHLEANGFARTQFRQDEAVSGIAWFDRVGG